MVTLGIGFLLGVLGLVVDVGYRYFVKQVAQAAADSAALAAVAAAVPTSGACGTAVVCDGTPTNCSASSTNPPATDFDSACLYAQKNGFTNSGAQTVTISSGRAGRLGRMLLRKRHRLAAFETGNAMVTKLLCGHWSRTGSIPTPHRPVSYAVCVDVCQPPISWHLFDHKKPASHSEEHS